MAGVELHKRVIENTLTDSTDQSHMEVLHLSRSGDVPDRTGFLLKNKGENPAFGMFRTIQIAAKSLEGKEIVAGIPCNTFHAPVIWNKFSELLEENNVKIQVLHMLKETAGFIRQVAPKAKRIGLMSTTGTRASKVYNGILEPDFEIMEVDENVQNELHDSIYNPKWGIKAVSPATEKARGNFLKYANILTSMGAEAIILGCTEIPIALPEKEVNGIPLIDPMVAL